MDNTGTSSALAPSAPARRPGRFTIFLGAARGVGTTSAMLQSALVKAREGTDVVVGVVDTTLHPDLGPHLSELDVLWSRVVEHRGRIFEELDIEALLGRRPALAVVEDLGAENAPGNRNAARYQDVELLLASGIDVYTTLNIEQIESLKEVVGRIIGIPARGLVPDSVVERADDLIVIDFTAEDLARRWKAGKVQLPAWLEGAADTYFSPPTLAALRDLALRRTAQRVDDQMLALIREYADSALRRQSETILVCIDEKSLGTNLLQYASQLAVRLQVKWIALHVETSRYARLPEADRNRIADSLRLAERLGAQAVMIPGDRAADEILAYARDNDVSTIILGRPRRPAGTGLLRPSIARTLVRKGTNLSVQVIGGDPRRSPDPRPRSFAAVRSELQPSSYVLGLASVAVATAFAWPLRPVVSQASVAMFYLLLVLINAVCFGFLPSAVASIAGVLAYDYFFTRPYYSLAVTSTQDVIALCVFLIVALITSSITARSRSQTEIARNSAKTTAELYGFSRRMAEITDLADLGAVAVRQISETVGVRTVLLVPDGGHLAPAAACPADAALDESGLAAADAIYRGRPAAPLADAGWHYIPLRTARRVVGVIAIARSAGAASLTPAQRRLLLALIDQTTVAFERILLVADNEQARILRETDKLRSSLLRSIAHDVRTPLASILGAVTALRSPETDFTEENRRHLLEIAEDEAERLNRFVGNLLDMMRLESGAFSPKRDVIDIADVIGHAVRRARTLVGGHVLTTDIAPDLPMLRLDGVLCEQALFNLLDNAAKYSPPGGPIAVRARETPTHVVIEVADAGEGIPEAELERIFDKFYRVQSGDRGGTGTGLGLTICRGFIEAQGGTIAAANRSDGKGAVFTISLPKDRALSAA